MSLQAAVWTIQNWLFKTKELNLNLSNQLAKKSLGWALGIHGGLCDCKWEQ